MGRSRTKWFSQVLGRHLEQKKLLARNWKGNIVVR
jgi:hypothetical protein